MTLGEFKIVGK